MKEIDRWLFVAGKKIYRSLLEIMMKKMFLLMALLILSVGVVNAGISPAPEPNPLAPPPIDPDDIVRAREQCSGSNLAANRSFEGPHDYTAYVPPGGHPDCPAGICTSVLTAPSWLPWWQASNADDGGVRGNPEYKAAVTTDIGASGIPGGRVLVGEAAQQYFSFFRTHRAGFYQQISGLTPGTTYRFCVWGHSWSSGAWQDPPHNTIPDTDFISGPEFGILDQKIGIDPTGGTDWPTDGTGANIVWSNPRTQYDQWGLFTVDATAQAETMTVYTFSEVQFSVQNNDVYWDEAMLVTTTTPDPIMHINPENSLTFLTETGNTVTETRQINISFDNDSGVGWSVVDNGGSVVPALDPFTGVATDPLMVTVGNGGLNAGIYTTSLTITASDPDTVNSPTDVPVRLVVVDELQYIYLPILSKP